MKRRTLIRAVAGSIAIGGTAGCLSAFGSDQSPPPRKSNVIRNISLMNDGEALKVTTVPDKSQWVMTRREINAEFSQAQSNTSDNRVNRRPPTLAGAISGLGALSPVGTVEAAKGRGATGRGRGGFSSAPRTSRGRAWYGGGAYASTWYNNHDDDVSRVPVTVGLLGIGFIGDNDAFTERSPGPGPIDWDETYDDSPREIQSDLSPRSGWYRVGTEVNAELAGGGTQSLGWECVDLRVRSGGNQGEISKKWKVSPRI